MRCDGGVGEVAVLSGHGSAVLGWVEEKQKQGEGWEEKMLEGNTIHLVLCIRCIMHPTLYGALKNAPTFIILSIVTSIHLATLVVPKP